MHGQVLILLGPFVDANNTKVARCGDVLLSLQLVLSVKRSWKGKPAFQEARTRV